jgi:hypothetical protein
MRQGQRPGPTELLSSAAQAGASQAVEGQHTAARSTRCLFARLKGLLVVLVLAVVVVDDPQDFDEAKGGPKPPQGRVLVGSTSAMTLGRLPLRWLVASGAEVQAGGRHPRPMAVKNGGGSLCSSRLPASGLVQCVWLVHWRS